jgi:hypothetical protein
MISVNAPHVADLLSRALSEPGVVSRAYSAFRRLAAGDQLFAPLQCQTRHPAGSDRDVHGLATERPISSKGREGDRLVHAVDLPAQAERAVDHEWRE